ncbi:MAG: hypothetical protein RL660_2339 [Bacteroidota bacterium]|jgi:hypothetical protein
MRIEPIVEFLTEGVLIIANITKCKEYYADKEFDYAYPEGLSDLLINGVIHIITTEEHVEEIHFIFDNEAFEFTEIDRRGKTWLHSESYNYMKVDEGDEVRLISHADFTQMCNNHKGDLEAQIDSALRIRNILNPNYPIDKETYLKENFPILDFPAGQWRVNVYSKTYDGGLLPDFAFHLQKMDTVELEKITLEPIEIFG